MTVYVTKPKFSLREELTSLSAVKQLKNHTRIIIDDNGNMGLSSSNISKWNLNSINTHGTGIDIAKEGTLVSMGGVPLHGTEFGRNFYFNGTTDLYKIDGAASKYVQVGGFHYWYTATSGTPEAPITDFNTPKVILTNNGRLGIGTTNPFRPLDIFGPSISDGSAAPWAKTVLRIASANTYTDSPAAGILFSNVFNSSGNTAGMGSIGVAKENSTNDDYSGYIFMTTRSNGADLTERVRITSTGRVGIGTTSPVSILDIRGTTSDTASVISHNGHIKASIRFDKNNDFNTGPNVRCWIQNYASCIITLNYAHTNSGNNGAHFIGAYNNSFGTIYSNGIIFSKLNVLGGITVNIYSPGDGGGAGYVEFAFPAGNGSAGSGSITVEGAGSEIRPFYFEIV